MDELTRTLAPLVEHPPASPTDLATIERRATARRRNRFLATGGLATVVVAGAAVAVATFGPVGTPTIDPVGPAPAVTPAPSPDALPTPPESGAPATAPPGPPATEEPSPGAVAPPPEVVPTDGSTDGPEFSDEEAEPHPDAALVEWVRDDGRIAWQQETGRDGMWVAGFFRTADDIVAGTETPPDRFWTRVADEGEDVPRDELFRLALATLTSRPPEGYDTAVAGVDLRVTSTFLDGSWLAIDHPSGTVLTDNGYGSAGAAEFAHQYLALVRHYFPEAETLCISIDGTESRENGPYILHDGIGCPWSLR